MTTTPAYPQSPCPQLRPSTTRYEIINPTAQTTTVLYQTNGSHFRFEHDNGTEYFVKMEDYTPPPVDKYKDAKNLTADDYIVCAQAKKMRKEGDAFCRSNTHQDFEGMSWRTLGL